MSIINGIIAFLCLVILGLGLTVYIYSEELAVAKADNATCLTVNKGWQEREEETRHQLERIQQENELLTAKAREALKAAQVEMAKKQTLSNQLKAIKADPADCNAAQALINQFLRGVTP